MTEENKTEEQLREEVNINARKEIAKNKSTTDYFDEAIEEYKNTPQDDYNAQLIIGKKLNRLELREEYPDIEPSVIDLLNEPELNIQYLDVGYIGDIWYYGFDLGGREAIVTSDKRILRNTEECFKGKTVGENQIKQLFEYKGYVGDIAPTIAKESIKKIITKESRNILISPKEVYKTIRDKILYYMDFSEKDEIADVLTCWIIATYCYPLFYWFPHILINAPSQSGKSKCAFILMQISFRGFDLGASAGVTPAQIFRTIEGNRGTIIVDEFERSDSETQKLVNQILNASATKDAYVIRTEQIDTKWKVCKFPIFCPKVVCNISGINPTSLSRFIPFKWLKTQSEKGKRKPYREQDKKAFEPIRENLYILILEHWKMIKELYDNGLDLHLNNREEDSWLPLFAVARFIDGSEGKDVNAEEQLNKYLIDYQDLNIETDDNTEEFFKILYDNVDEKQQYLTPKEIAQLTEVQELLSYLKSPAHWIGKKLKLYKFNTNRSGGVRKYLLSKESVKNIIDLYGTDITPLNNTNNTQQHKQHTTTQEEDVSLGTIGVITPKANEEPSDDDLIQFVKEKQEQNGKGYEMQEFAEKYGEAKMQKLLKQGELTQMPAGWLRVM